MFPPPPRSAVILLGRLSVGSARHRALLFKLLADAGGIACQLVRGGYLPGCEDQAFNLVTLDGKDWVVDLVVAPGRLLPQEEVVFLRKNIKPKCKAWVGGCHMHDP